MVRRTRSHRTWLGVVSAVLLALATFVPCASAASLLAVDYGTDSFKASLVKPGVPFDVLLTKEGKRKVPTLVSFRGEDRFVGADAANLVSRRRDTIQGALSAHVRARATRLHRQRGSLKTR